MTPSTIRWCQEHVAALEVEHIGTDVHFEQERDRPAIGVAIARWRELHRLVKEPSRRAKSTRGPRSRAKP